MEIRKETSVKYFNYFRNSCSLDRPSHKHKELCDIVDKDETEVFSFPNILGST